MKVKFDIKITILLLLLISCKSVGKSPQVDEYDNNKDNFIKENITMNSDGKMSVAVFGAGCFWCVEAVFQELNGVHKVESGYTGGDIKNPTYNEICTGETGHAEVAKITFDPNIVSFELLLSVFFKTHNPTTLNMQGADRGTQYRSAIFYTSEQQKEIAQRIINELNTEKAYPNPIVTELTKLETL